jgi:hypothetical protein
MAAWRELGRGARKVCPKSVPLCRAAIGALEKKRRERTILAMQRLRYIREWIRRRRIKRWGREIMLAVILTLAAAIFIAVALLRENGAPQAKAPYATARQPANN